MMPSPSAITLLADMKALGITVQALGGAIRFNPQSAMTAALMERLKANKAELLQLLNTEAAIAEVRRSIERLWKDPAWRSAWERRFTAARYADFASLRGVLDLVFEQAEEHHRRRDWKAFASACQYLHRLASGDEWDAAKPIQDGDRWNIEI